MGKDALTTAGKVSTRAPRLRRRALLVLASMAAMTVSSLGSASAAAAADPAERVIVVLKGGATANRSLATASQSVRADAAASTERTSKTVSSRHRVKTSRTYSNLFSGFTGTVPRSQLTALASDPNVQAVYRDVAIRPFAGEVPTGVQRMRADTMTGSKIGTRTAVDVDIAILDTGVNSHADLNLAGGANCLSDSGCTSSSFADTHGHGTHVAGTAAAKDNGLGVVGTAPGARIWGVKVLGDNGGYMSWFISGLDWVVARGDIEVVNASLGGGGSPYDAVAQAVSRAVAAGVVVVVAAGNENQDAANVSPANAADAITVSAFADSDGGGGGRGPSACGMADDTRATFSNYGTTVDVAAPGVCITSTSRDGSYTTMSGTSMASPHVAGAAAAYIALHNVPKNSSRSATVVNAFRGEWGAGQQSAGCGFTGGRSSEPVVIMGGCPDGGDTVAPRPVTLTATPDAASVRLNWTAATDSSGITGYRIYKASGATGAFALATTASGTDLTFTDTGLTNKSTYRYYVSAVDGGGNASASNIVTTVPADLTAPTAPTLTAVPHDKSVELTWTKPSDVSGLKSFTVYRALPGSAFAVKTTTAGTATTYKDTLLTNGTIYRYYVVATDGALNASPASSTISVAPVDDVAPTAPTPTISVGDGSLTLTWKAATDSTGVASYVISRAVGVDGSFTQRAVVNSPTVTYTDTGLTNGTIYRYTVVARDTLGNTSSAPRVVQSTPKDLTAPTSVTLSGASEDPSVALANTMSWTVSSDATGVASYKVYRAAGSGAFAVKATIASSAARTYRDASVLSGTTYRYYIAAIDTVGNVSAASNTLSLTARDTAAPASPVLTVVPHDKSAALSWTPVTDVTGIKNYQVWRAAPGGSLTLRATLTPTAKAYADSALNNGSSYTYRIVAMDNAGNGGNSNDVSVLVADDAAPSAPSPTATASDRQVALKWSAATDSSGISSYAVYRAIGSGTFNLLTTVDGSQLTYADTGLANGTAYRYYVTATDGVDLTSGTSRIVSGSPKDLLAPAAVTASGSATDGSVTLTWSAATDSSGIKGYRIYRSTGTGTFVLITTTAANVTEYVNTGLLAGTAYRYQVKPLDMVNNLGAASNTVSLSTPSTAVQVAAAAPVIAAGSTTAAVTVLLTLTSEYGKLIDKASVSAALRTGGGTTASSVKGVTNAAGQLALKFTAPKGACYSVAFTAITAQGRTWDGATPNINACI